MELLKVPFYHSLIFLGSLPLQILEFLLNVLFAIPLPGRPSPLADLLTPRPPARALVLRAVRGARTTAETYLLDFHVLVSDLAMMIESPRGATSGGCPGRW